MFAVSVWRDGKEIARSEGEEEAVLLFREPYETGDQLRFEADCRRVCVQADQQIAPARLYLPQRAFAYRIPLEGDNPLAYPPGTFPGTCHLISIRRDPSNEYRNLAENPADQRGNTDAYPHAAANVETRNESQFAARNVIDGVHAASRHGHWPYASWGIGGREDACLTLDFGREVELDCAVLYLRADFPHDAWWVSGRITLDDGAEISFPLVKKDGAQRVPFGETHRTRFLKLDSLKKCDCPSPFPALRQLEAYGRDCE